MEPQRPPKTWFPRILSQCMTGGFWKTGGRRVLEPPIQTREAFVFCIYFGVKTAPLGRKPKNKPVDIPMKSTYYSWEWYFLPTSMANVHDFHVPGTIG